MKGDKQKKTKPEARSASQEDQVYANGADWIEPMTPAEIEAGDRAMTASMERAIRRFWPRMDVPKTMEDIRTRFPSYTAFLESSADMIGTLGFLPRNALMLSCIPTLAGMIERESFGRKPRLNHVDLAGRYLTTFYHGVNIERFYILCLDRIGRLIECKLVQTGSGDSAPFYLKNVLVEIVRTRAKAVVISHNHPNWSARPSQPDLSCTLELLVAVQAIGVLLLDHIIVYGHEYVSLRQHGFIRSRLWLAQGPNSKLQREWLNEE